MFLNFKNGIYEIAEKSENAVAELKPPIILENGSEYILQPEGNGYSGNKLNVSESITDCGNGLFLINRKLENSDSHSRNIRFVFEADTLFEPRKYLIPCVSYNGNDFGEGKEPKGLTCDGEMWLHAYDRVSIPSCTLSENENTIFSAFVSDCDKSSLESCCGMLSIPNGIRHRIMWPANEQPYTYADNDKMAAPLFEKIALAPGEVLDVSFMSSQVYQNGKILDLQRFSMLSIVCLITIFQRAEPIPNFGVWVLRICALW